MLCIDDWEIVYYDGKLQVAILSMPAGILARYLHCTDRMIRYGTAHEVEPVC